MLSDQLEPNRRAMLVEAAVHRKSRHSSQIAGCRVAQQFRNIALRHLDEFRGAWRRRIQYRDQQDIDIREHMRNLTGELVTEDMSLPKLRSSYFAACFQDANLVPAHIRRLGLDTSPHARSRPRPSTDASTRLWHRRSTGTILAPNA